MKMYKEINKWKREKMVKEMKKGYKNERKKGRGD